MKKLLGSALTLALVFPSGPASAELLKNLKVMGGVDLQTNYARNVLDFRTNQTAGSGAGALSGLASNDRISNVHTRTWLGLGWDLLDDVHAKVTLRKNDRSWGNTSSGGGAQGPGGSQVLNSGDPGGVLGNLFVNEANMKIDKLMGHIDATIGRQFWGEPGDLIAFWGPKNTYGLTVTAIDALGISASNDMMDVSAIAGKTVGTAVGGNAAAPCVDLNGDGDCVDAGEAAATTRDTDVAGVDLGWKMLPVKVHTFVWNRILRGNGAMGQPPTATLAAAVASGLNDNLWLYGVKLKAEGMGGWVNATVAANSGSNRSATGTVPATGVAANSANYSGKGLLLDMGYKMDVADVGGFTPWATWGWGSGRHDTTSNHNENFTTISSDFRPGVIYGRFSTAGVAGGILGSGVGAGATYDGAGGLATPGLTNRIIWGGGLKFNCARTQKMSLGLSYWDFNYQRATQAGLASSAGVGNPVAKGNRHIGSEIDIQLDWAHSENVMLSGGWAQFQPGGFVKETVNLNSGGSGAGVNPASLVFADLSVKF